MLFGKLFAHFHSVFYVSAFSLRLVLSGLLHVLKEKVLELVPRNHLVLAAVVEVAMGGAGDDEEFLASKASKLER